MPWRIEVGGILKRLQIFRRITQAWLLLVIVGSLQPNRLLKVVGFLRHARLLVAIGSAQPDSTGPVINLHREIHWLAFGGAALLLLLLSRDRRQEIRSVIATCLLGLSMEYLQHLIYHSPMEWYDVHDDALAALVALALYRLAGTCKAGLPIRAPRSGVGNRESDRSWQIVNTKDRKTTRHFSVETLRKTPVNTHT